MRLIPNGLRKIGLATAAVAATCGLFAGGAATAYAGTVSGTNGTLTIVDSSQNTLNSGGSTTTYYVKPSLTPGKPAADCSADSASGSTFVYSYAVHQSVDPTTLSYSTGHPAGTGAAYGSTAYGMFGAGGAYYGGQTTAPNTGQVPTDGVPFQWNPPLGSTRVSSVLYNGTSSPASWNVGIACWNSATSAITDYWNVVITFNPDQTDSAGYTWTAANNPQQSVPEVPLPIILPLGAAVLIGGGVLFARRRRPTTPSAA